LITVVSQKPISVHTQIYTYNALFVRPEPRDEFTKLNFADALSFTGPLIEKWSDGDSLMCD
jgi:hypothetical protein